MNKPSQVFPGLTLIHHFNPQDLFNKVTTGIEDWGEWTGASKEDLQANHVEGTYDDAHACRMNPPRSMLYPIEEVPWASVVAMRLDLSALPLVLGGRSDIPKYPDEDPKFVANLQTEVSQHLGEPYAWGIIFGFALVGSLARIWPWAAQQVMKQPNLLAGAHSNVCTPWWTKRLNAAVKKTYNIPTFNLFDGWIGEGQERPADFLNRSPYLKVFES